MVSTVATIRPMHWTDLANVESLERRLFAVDPWTSETFWSELANVPDTRCYLVVVDEDQRILGYAGVMTVGDDADVQTIAVDEAARGRGIGRMLVHAMNRVAVERGCTTMFLEVRADNAAARRLYEREGFEVMGTRRDYYGAGVDGITMRRRLASDGAS